MEDSKCMYAVIIIIIIIVVYYYYQRSQQKSSMLDGSVFAMFKMNGCRACELAMPEFDKLGSQFRGTQVLKVDASNTRVLSLFGVQKFPTFIWAPNGLANPAGMVVYDGPRTYTAFLEFLKKLN